MKTLSTLLLLTCVITTGRAGAQIARYVPSEYGTIQDALNAASEGDTIRVAPGEYRENLYWSDVSAIKLISESGAANTIIRGQHPGNTITIFPQYVKIDTSTVIDGFTITGGDSEEGGGILCVNSGLLVRNSVIRDNTSTGWPEVGAGLRLKSPSSTLWIDNTTFENNYAEARDLGADGVALHAKVKAVHLQDVTFSGNYVENTYPSYISIAYMDADTVSVINTTSADNYAGAISMKVSRAYIRNLHVRDNDIGGLTIEGRAWGMHASAPVWTEGISVANNQRGSVYFANADLSLTQSGITVVRNGFGSFVVDSDMRDAVFAENAAGVTARRSILNGITASSNEGPEFLVEKSRLQNVTVTEFSAEFPSVGIEFSGTGEESISYSNIIVEGRGASIARVQEYVDGTNNYWGHSSGPYNARQNTTAAGDSTDAFINVIPFLPEPDVDAPPVPVTGLSVASRGSDYVEFHWDTSLLSDLAGYRLFWTTDSTEVIEYAHGTDLLADTSYTLSRLETGETYYVAARTVDTDGNESWYSPRVTITPTSGVGLEARSDVLTEYALTDNYPNPFNPTTRFEYVIPSTTHVRIVVLDVLGRCVRTLVDRHMPSGRHSVFVDLSGLTSGVYVYRITTESGYVSSRKMLLVK